MNPPCVLCGHNTAWVIKNGVGQAALCRVCFDSTKEFSLQMPPKPPKLFSGYCASCEINIQPEREYCDKCAQLIEQGQMCRCPSSGHAPTCPLRNLSHLPAPNGCEFCGERLVEGHCNDPSCPSNIPLPPEPDPLKVIGQAILDSKPPALPKMVFKFLVQVEIEQDALHCTNPVGPVACSDCCDNQRSYLKAVISAHVSNYLIGKDPLHWFPYKPSITVTPTPES